MTIGFSNKQQAAKWKQHLTLALPKRPDQECIWIHACSVGEVNSVTTLITALLDRGETIHLTVVTETGMQRATHLFGERLHLSYLPWDIPGTMARLIDRIRPRLLLLTETEFWPGMLSACGRRHIPVIGINTRISDRSFPRYMATRWLWRYWLRPARLFLAQGRIDAERLEELGIAPEQINTVGNLKYAITPPKIDADAVRRKLDPSGVRPIVLVASTHDDEECQILKMWPEWKRIRNDLMLLIVPRHPERFDAVADTIASQGLSYGRWSELETMAGDTSPDILLVNAMGILQQLYAIADIAVIGGSLVPIGGHNPLEAAVCGRGVVTGPHIQNFREIMAEMVTDGVAIVTDSAEELEGAVLRLLKHPDELRNLHMHAAEFIHKRQGILDKVLEAIEPWLQEKREI